MKYLVNSSEMKRCDKNTIEHYGMPQGVLMERAALAVFNEITTRFKEAENSILVVCGNGNNGGDGLAVARLLHLAGYPVDVYLPMDMNKATRETKAQYVIIQKYGILERASISSISGRHYDIIVDGLFGIGLSRSVEGELKELVTLINKKDAYKIAIDISSGINTDDGQVLGVAFAADLTVTFGFAKIGQMLYPGAEYTGELIIADIGIDENGFLGEFPAGRVLEKEDAGILLPQRRAYSNKGSYGKVLIIAGSPKMAGAAYLSAKAAYYSGCGLVRILTAEENREILLTKLPEAIVTTYNAKTEDFLEVAPILEACMEWADAVLVGPGLGTNSNAKMLVAKVLQYAGKNIVFDADALNILSKNLTLLKESKCNKVITPHLGEMSRLLEMDIAKIKENLIETATSFAKEYHTVCVLKDARTVIGNFLGEYVINITGNHGMATGGSGDILSGLITGFFAQGISDVDTAILSCYLHGMAGDLTAEEKGSVSMLASDLLEKIPTAIQSVSDGGIR